jgi:hypothetical protein
MPRDGASFSAHAAKFAFVLFLTLAFLGVRDLAIASVDWPGEDVPAEGLKVGDEVLVRGNGGDIPTLTYKGRTVVSSTNTYATPPFSVLDRWSDAGTSAVLLQAGVTATKDCSTIYVVESRKPGSVSSHELGIICVGLDMPTVERNEEGFVFSEVPTPTKPAPVRQWQARTGNVVDSKIEFHPDIGSTMARLASGPSPELAEPLRNAEFHSAVLRAPKAQQRRVLEALWQVANGCPLCGGSAQKELYGVAIDAHTVAYSGCGWWMNGAWLTCGTGDALAVWDRERDGFYFASDAHRPDGNHDDAAILSVWPALEAWPAAARDRFETWRNGRNWLPGTPLAGP